MWLLKETEGESDLESKKLLVDTSIYTKDNVPFFKKTNLKVFSLCVYMDYLLKDV